MIIKPDIFTNKSIGSQQSTRLGGVSEKPYDSMNLGIFGNDKQANENTKLFTGLPHAPVFMQQVHSNKVVEYVHVPEAHGQITADACFTRKKNIVCCVLTADCLPVLIADKQASVVAAIHCGWRSLFANILKQTIAQLNCENSELQCWLGPCISYKPYQVNAEFRQKFVAKDKDLAHCFYLDKKKKWHADLKKIAVTQLKSLGITQITQSPYCTYDNKNLFFSYRRDGETGRMASMIWIKE